MQIISLEGLDKSGKCTQTEMLVKRLVKEGYNVAKSEFHRYDTPTGEYIGKWLRGQYDVDQITIELIMAADKQAQQPWFKQLEEEGYDFLILDRYTLSQYVYGSISGARSGYEPSMYHVTRWIKQLLEHVREPDFTFLIDIPAELSMLRKGKHNNGQNDRYESDLQLLEDVRERYLGMLESDVDGVIIDGTMSPEEVHESIWQSMLHYVL